MASIGNVIHFEIFLDQKTMEASQLKMNPSFDATMNPATSAMELNQRFFKAEKCQ